MSIVNLQKIGRNGAPLGLACWTLLAVIAPNANAANTAGICMSASVGASGSVTYGSNTGCSGGFGVGLNFTNIDGAASLTTNPSPLIAGLTTGSMQMSSSSTSGSSSVFSSLEQGKLSASSIAGSARSIASGLLFDFLHFTITDGAPSAPVTVNIHLSGSQTGGVSGSFGNGVDVSFAGASFSYFTRSNPPGFGFSGCCNPTGFASFNVANMTATGFDFTGVVNVTNGESTGMYLHLLLDCSVTEVCDYTNTATFSWVLPGNVQVTSDSGVFLSQVQPANSLTIGPANLNVVPGSTGSFALKATVALSSPTATFDPVTQPATLKVGPYQVTIPANSFHMLQHGAKTGSWVYSGTVNGVSLDFQINPLGGGQFEFKANGSPVDFTTLTDPSTVSITVGNASGTAQVVF